MFSFEPILIVGLKPDLWGWAGLAGKYFLQAFATSLLFFLSLAAKADTRFEVACEKLAAEAVIRVVFEDRPVARDDSQGLDVLKRLSGSGTNAYHNVLGLTHAEPTASLDLAPRVVSDSDGRACAVPSLTLKLGFSSMQIYLARELKDACRRRIVDEHEQEHVAVWRNHLRAGARMLEVLLRGKLGRPAYFRNPAEAEQGLPRRVNELIAPLLKDLKDGIGASQQQIDSAASYQYVEGQMRACP